MIGNGNGEKKELNGFVRAMFWTLILGSFAWATTILFVLAHANTCTNERVNSVCNEMVSRDEKTMAFVSTKFEDMKSTLSSIQTDISWIKYNKK